MTYASEDWMARFILGFGAEVQVLAPESLATRVRQAAEAALQAYAVAYDEADGADEAATHG